LIEAFGEPKQHTNAKEADTEIWKQGVEKFRIAEKKMHRNSSERVKGCSEMFRAWKNGINQKKRAKDA